MRKGKKNGSGHAEQVNEEKNERHEIPLIEPIRAVQRLLGRGQSTRKEEPRPEARPRFTPGRITLVTFIALIGIFVHLTAETEDGIRQTVTDTQPAYRAAASGSGKPATPPAESSRTDRPPEDGGISVRRMRIVLYHTSSDGLETTLKEEMGRGGSRQDLRCQMSVRGGALEEIHEGSCPEILRAFLGRTGTRISGDSVCGAVVLDDDALRRIIRMSVPGNQ